MTQIIERIPSLKENEAVIRDGLRSFNEVGRALLTVRDHEQYKDEGFTSFEEYCEKRWDLGKSHAYRLMDASSVVANLGDVKVLPSSEATIRPMTGLNPELQQKIWGQAVTAAGDKPPTASLVQRLVDKVRSLPGAKKKQKEPGWSREDLAKDKDLLAAFDRIRSVYGKPDTDTLLNGTIETVGKKDIIFLSKLPADKMESVRNLILGNHWTPQYALAFLGKMPDLQTTLEEMESYCLATKGLYTQVQIGGFEFTCKGLRAAAKR